MQAVLSRLLDPGVHAALPPGSSCATLHALASMRAPHPPPLHALLMQRVLQGMEGTGGPSPASPDAPNSPDSPAVSPPLDALQLSSVLWSVARLGARPREQWLSAYMAATYPLMEVSA